MTSIRWRLIWISALAAISVYSLVPRNVREPVYDPATSRMSDSVRTRTPIALGLDLRGGVHLALEVDRSRASVDNCAEAIRASERVVRSRLDQFGTAEPLVQVVGDCRLVVELPGVHDAGRAREIVQRTAFLELRIVDPRDRLRPIAGSLDRTLHRTDPFFRIARPGASPGELVVAESQVAEAESLLALPETQRLIPPGLELRWASEPVIAGRDTLRSLYGVVDRAAVTGAELRTATAAVDPGTNAPEVRFELSRDAGRRFADVTARNIGHGLAVLLDGRVHGPPAEIQERIGAIGRIRMPGRSIADASDLALVLRAGALPVPLMVVEQRTIGPSLGEDSIDAGVRASILAVAFVVIVMGAYYRFAGILAVAALLVYVLYSLGALATFGSTLTLPGLAGFALSIGMAVDANVLIFERMREERSRGRSPRQSMNAGFSNAMSAIVDSNVTTALTAVILYMMGTDSVRGFAVTLLIGLAASMVTAVFVTRTFFLVWLHARPEATPVNPDARRPFAHSRFDFIRVRRWAYVLTAAIVVPAMVLIAAHGMRYGIEFTGGSLIQLRTNAPIETARLRAALASQGLPDAELRHFGSPRDHLIRARGEDEAVGPAATEAIARRVRSAMDVTAGPGEYEIVRTESIGASVSEELEEKALAAVALSFGTTLAYLAVRFHWRFGVAAVVATAHDVLATIAFIWYSGLEIDLVVLAAILTVLGYSLNDTIVIFDRVRENQAADPRARLADVLNRSVSETLPRTILTGGITLATALVLSFVGGEGIRPFALVMGFGIVVGTFSSIFVAGPVLLLVEGLRGRRVASGREVSV